MNRYLVIYEHTCPVCNGERYIHNTEWEQANDAYDKAQAATSAELGEPADEETYYNNMRQALDAAQQALGAFWAERGYFNERNWPPEDAICYECEGSGIVREEVDLEVALYNLPSKINL